MPARRFAVAVSLLTMPLAACGDSPVAAKPAAQAGSRACVAASALWPDTVAGLRRFPDSAHSATVRAWGSDAERAVIARCGVTSPGPTSDACFSANDVDWVQMSLGDGNRYVTYGRQPAIEVLVPNDAHVDGTALAAFAPAAKKIPQGEHHCS